MYGVENRFKMQLFLGLKGSPLVGVGITNFATPEEERGDEDGDLHVPLPAGGRVPHVRDRLAA